MHLFPIRGARLSTLEEEYEQLYAHSRYVKAQRSKDPFFPEASEQNKEQSPVPVNVAN